MIVILSLPEALARFLLTDWLQIEDVARMDSAFCQRVLRPNFLRLVYNRGTVYDTRHVVHRHVVHRHVVHGWKFSASDFLQWAIVRGVHVTTILVDVAFEAQHDLRSAFLTNTGAQIKSIFYDSMVRLDSSWRGSWIDLVNLCPNVTELICCQNFTTFDCSLIGQTWPNLESIQMSDRATDACFHEIALCCHRLQRFHGGNASSLEITREGWKNFLRQAGQCLKCIDGTSSPNQEFDADTFRAIAEYCPNLRSYCADSSNMDHASLETLLRGCPNLTELSLVIACQLRRDSSLKLIAQLCGANLRVLRLISIEAVTNSGVEKLVQACHNLETLEISYPFGEPLTDADLQVIAQHCPQLRDLNISYQRDGLGDAGLCAVATGCTKLERLNVAHTTVGDAGITAVLVNCPHLRYLCVQDCREITEEGLTSVARLRPEVTELYLGDTAITLIGVTSIVQSCHKLRILELPRRLVSEFDGLAAVRVLLQGKISSRNLRVIA